LDPAPPGSLLATQDAITEGVLREKINQAAQLVTVDQKALDLAVRDEWDVRGSIGIEQGLIILAQQQKTPLQRRLIELQACLNATLK
jgi:hypothetical protein